MTVELLVSPIVPAQYPNISLLDTRQHPFGPYNCFSHENIQIEELFVISRFVVLELCCGSLESKDGGFVILVDFISCESSFAFFVNDDPVFLRWRLEKNHLY